MQTSSQGTLAVPRSVNASEAIAAIEGRMAGTREQIASLELDQARLMAELQKAPDDRRTSIEVRLRTVFQEINQKRQELSSLQDQVHRYQLIEVPPPAEPIVLVPPRMLEERILGYPKTEFFGVLMLVCFVPSFTALAWRIFRSGRREAVQSTPADDARLVRLEQAMESVALEVERIGEAQRFQTKLMSESRIMTERREPLRPVITPH